MEEWDGRMRLAEAIRPPRLPRPPHAGRPRDDAFIMAGARVEIKARSGQGLPRPRLGERAGGAAPARRTRRGPPAMHESFTEGALRALERAQARARGRGVAA